MESRHLKGKQVICIDGYWYDITTFIPRHPGGDVIKSFIGKDASDVFHAFHKKEVLKYRRPCGQNISEKKDPVSTAFEELREELKQDEYFCTDYLWYTMKFAHAFTLLAICYMLMACCSSLLAHIAAGLFLAAFWQQCGFFMHDFMHNQFTGDRHIDQSLGTFFATVCFGVNGSWWRDEHFVHHALTNSIDYETKFVDPQMIQDTWAQSTKLFPFFKGYLSYFLIKIQYITFLPLCMIGGRYAIMIKSMAKETRVYEIIAFVMHWVWICKLFSYLDTYQERFMVYAIAGFIEGILHIQLLISHYSKPFGMVKEISADKGWYQMQVERNIDITCPWWLDWFHGGLNFHLVHHLYPRMPRNNYRKATDQVMRVCKEQGLHYDSCSWIEAVIRTLKHLKETSYHFSLDPR